MSLVLDAAAQDLLFREARSARAFTPEPVTDAQLRAVHELVKYGPTAFNGCPLRITLVRSAQARARLLPLIAESNRRKAESAPLTAILSADREFHRELPRLAPHDPGIAGRYLAEPAVREEYALVNAAMQAGYFLLGVRAAGLAAGPLIGFDAEAVREEFLDADRIPLMLLNIGRPAAGAWHPREPRLDYGEVVTVA